MRMRKGEQTRTLILNEAVALASQLGLEGLSIGSLAERLDMSKSGLFAHFGSKEELQLATIQTAGALFAEQVIEPAAAAPTALDRLRQLTENYLRHVEGAYPGGCFFAALTAEMDTHPGPVRDQAVQFMDGWLRRLETAVRDAQAEGAIDPAENAAQLAFELEGFLVLANAMFVIRRESTPIDRARRAIERRLAAAAGT